MTTMKDDRRQLSEVTADHVRQAVQGLRDAPGRRGGSYFVVVGDRELPAKLVLRESFRIAFGREIHPSAFSGGVYTQGILEALGFRVITRP